MCMLMCNDPQISIFINWLNNYIKNQFAQGNTPTYNDSLIIEELSKIKNPYTKKYLIEKHLCKKFKNDDRESIILFYTLEE